MCQWRSSARVEYWTASVHVWRINQTSMGTEFHLIYSFRWQCYRPKREFAGTKAVLQRRGEGGGGAKAAAGRRRRRGEGGGKTRSWTCVRATSSAAARCVEVVAALAILAQS
jgi:hypothetical protein